MSGTHLHLGWRLVQQLGFQLVQRLLVLRWLKRCKGFGVGDPSDRVCDPFCRGFRDRNGSFHKDFASNSLVHGLLLDLGKGQSEKPQHKGSEDSSLVHEKRNCGMVFRSRRRDFEGKSGMNRKVVASQLNLRKFNNNYNNKKSKQ